MLIITIVDQPGHISMANGRGLDYQDEGGKPVRMGVAPNELTDCRRRDEIAGTPWHKYVVARLEEVEGPTPVN